MKSPTSARPLTVAIFYHAGVKQDDEDTMECAKGIEEALTRGGHQVQKVAVTEANWRDAIQAPADVVVNLVEDDQWKLYITVGRALEKLGRAQLGHDLASFDHVTKKAWVKRQLKKHGISTPASMIINKTSKLPTHLQFPLIVKPSEQHAGIGISQKSVVKNQEELTKQVAYLCDHFPGEIIIEEFITGREIHVTVIGNGKNILTLPLCEIGYGEKSKAAWNIYSYDAKWDKKSWEYWNARVEAPAPVSAALQKKIETLAKKAYRALGCRDVARMDVRIDEQERPYIIDVNMNPSLNYYDEEDATLVSLYALKWTYDQFIETLVQTAYKRVHG